MEAIKPYPLHERCALFAKDVRVFLRNIPFNIASIEDGKQLVRSSGSIGANYLEANDSLGKKDILFRFRISRKEAKESLFWLKLIDVGNDAKVESDRRRLCNEVIELAKILSAIIKKIESHN
jgi:four helix bundle protein